MNPHTLEIIGSWLGKTWAVVGPLVGVVIGAWLSRSWQRKQWVLDSKKAEYRELLSTLSESFHVILMTRAVKDGRFDEQARQQSMDAGVAGLKSMEDRLFIEKRLRKSDIFEKWNMLVPEFEPKHLRARWNDLHAELVRMAHNDLGIKD